MMTEIQMINKLYEYYKLDWLMFHGYTLQDIIDAMDEYFSDEDYEQPEEYDTGILPTRENMLNEWEHESGFNGEIYACFDEFCETELEDRNYIYDLLEKIGDISFRTELRKAYTEYVKV